MTKDVTFEQMSASLGSLLLLWARIERSARDEVARFHEGEVPKSAYGIAAVLNTWEADVKAVQPDKSLRTILASMLRCQLQSSLDMRNGICHGLIGIRSATDMQSAALSWELNGFAKSATWDELQDMFRWLSKVPAAISMISTSPADQAGSRMTDSPENREWWLSEFGLDLASGGGAGANPL